MLPQCGTHTTLFLRWTNVDWTVETAINMTAPPYDTCASGPTADCHIYELPSFLECARLIFVFLLFDVPGLSYLIVSIWRYNFTSWSRHGIFQRFILCIKSFDIKTTCYWAPDEWSMGNITSPSTNSGGISISISTMHHNININTFGQYK